MFERIDDVRIDLPLGWQVSSIPKEINNDQKVVSFTMKAENDKGTLHLQRQLKSALISLERKYYGALRSFYQDVRSADEQQIVLQPAGAISSN